MAKFRCANCGKQFEADKEEWRKVAKAIVNGKYPPLLLADGSKTEYVRGKDLFNCPACGEDVLRLVEM